MTNSVVGWSERHTVTLDQTCEILNLSRSTLYRMEKKGLFPKRTNISEKKKGYFVSQILKWKGVK